MKPISIPTDVTDSINRVRVLAVTPSEMPDGYKVTVTAPDGHDLGIRADCVAFVQMRNPHVICVLAHDEFSRCYQEVQVME